MSCNKSYRTFEANPPTLPTRKGKNMIEINTLKETCNLTHEFLGHLDQEVIKKIEGAITLPENQRLCRDVIELQKCVTSITKTLKVALLRSAHGSEIGL